MNLEEKNIFSKNVEIKNFDIVIFPNNIEFLQITNTTNAKCPQQPKPNLLKKKEIPQNISQKPKISSENTKFQLNKLKTEIKLLESSIEKKMEQNKPQLNEKELVKNEELQKLIIKWRKVGQECLIELQKCLKSNSQTNEKINFKELFKAMNIDSKLFKYNEEEEEFEN